jgi:hypothetical protein
MNIYELKNIREDEALNNIKIAEHFIDLKKIPYNKNQYMFCESAMFRLVKMVNI